MSAVILRRKHSEMHSHNDPSHSLVEVFWLRLLCRAPGLAHAPVAAPAARARGCAPRVGPAHEGSNPLKLCFLAPEVTEDCCKA